MSIHQSISCLRAKKTYQKGSGSFLKKGIFLFLFLFSATLFSKQDTQDTVVIYWQLDSSSFFREENSLVLKFYCKYNSFNHKRNFLYLGPLGYQYKKQQFISELKNKDIKFDLKPFLTNLKLMLSKLKGTSHPHFVLHMDSHGLRGRICSPYRKDIQYRRLLKEFFKQIDHYENIFKKKIEITIIVDACFSGSAIPLVREVILKKTSKTLEPSVLYTNGKKDKDGKIQKYFYKVRVLTSARANTFADLRSLIKSFKKLRMKSQPRHGCPLFSDRFIVNFCNAFEGGNFHSAFLSFKKYHTKFPIQFIYHKLYSKNPHTRMRAAQILAENTDINKINIKKILPVLKEKNDPYIWAQLFSLIKQLGVKFKPYVKYLFSLLKKQYLHPYDKAEIIKFLNKIFYPASSHPKIWKLMLYHAKNGSELKRSLVVDMLVKNYPDHPEVRRILLESLFLGTERMSRFAESAMELLDKKKRVSLLLEGLKKYHLNFYFFDRARYVLLGLGVEGEKLYIPFKKALLKYNSHKGITKLHYDFDRIAGRIARFYENLLKKKNFSSKEINVIEKRWKQLPSEMVGVILSKIKKNHTNGYYNLKLFDKRVLKNLSIVWIKYAKQKHLLPKKLKPVFENKDLIKRMH